MLPVKEGLFHGLTRKAFRRPVHRRLWCGKIFSGGNRRLALCLIFVPPWKKSIHVFSKGKTKVSVQSFSFIFKLVLWSPQAVAKCSQSCPGSLACSWLCCCTQAPAWSLCLESVPCWLCTAAGPTWLLWRECSNEWGERVFLERGRERERASLLNWIILFWA